MKLLPTVSASVTACNLYQQPGVSAAFRLAMLNWILVWKKRGYIPIKELPAAWFPEMWNEMQGGTETSQEMSCHFQRRMWDFSVVSLFACTLFEAMISHAC